MVGITLSPEQIQQAPPEVRQWIEQQIASALGIRRTEPQMHAPSRHLIGCNVDQARAILSQVQQILPAVGVFFELGREPVARSAQGLRALRLDDMMRHARLQAPEQVVACLEALDAALQRACGDPNAALTALDGAGHCLVADVTARSIVAVWQEIVAARQVARPQVAPAPAVPQPAAPTFQMPYAVTMAPPVAVPEPMGNAAE